MSMYADVPLSVVAAPESPLRSAMERGGIEELAASIRELGLLQPLVVKRCENGFEVVAGHRRLLACRWLGVDRVTVRILDGEDELTRAAMLAENVIRQDLGPVEEARAVQAMVEVMGLTVAQVAQRVSKSEAWVRGRLDLLRWPMRALGAIQAGEASMSALAPLMEVEDEGERDRLIACAVESGATAAVTRAWLAGWRGEQYSSGRELSARSQAAMELADYVVMMPCWCCRESHKAVDLRFVRLCDPCLDVLSGRTVAEGNGSGAPSGVP